LFLRLIGNLGEKLKPDVKVSPQNTLKYSTTLDNYPKSLTRVIKNRIILYSFKGVQGMEYLLGFDIGGTKTEVSLFQMNTGDGQFKVSCQGAITDIKLKYSKRMPTARKDGYESYLKNIVSLVETTLNENNLSIDSIDAIGLALPGSVHPQTKKMLNGNTLMLIGKDFVSDFSKALNFKKKISANNDASCFALAEALCGAGLKYQQSTGIPIKDQQSIGIILGTGCGGGLILGGKIIEGAKGGGGEIGHTTLVSEGHPCYCGRHGCAEQYLAGPAIEATMATRLSSQLKESPSSEEIFRLAKEGDTLALGVVKDYREKLADFLINLNNIYDPHYFVLGGGVSKQKLIYEDLESELSKKMFVAGITPNIYQHQLSDSAGGLGAAILTL
jgi:predicted NBD/HSP70 family sugar kinase